MIVSFIGMSKFQLKFFKNCGYSFKIRSGCNNLSTFSKEESGTELVANAKLFQPEIRNHDKWNNHLRIHKRLYNLLVFRFSAWNYFSNLVMVFWKHERLPCDTKPLIFFLYLSCSSHAPYFSFSLVCFSHPVPNFFFIDRFPSDSTFFNMLIVLKYIHSVFCDRSSSFNKILCLLFMNAFETTKFRQEFCARSSSLKIFELLRWIMKSSNALTVRFREICVAKSGKRKAGAAFKSVFGSAESGALRELGTKQVRQVLRTALLKMIIWDSDTRVVDMFRNFFQNEWTVSHVNYWEVPLSYSFRE